MWCGWPCCLGGHRGAQCPYVRPHQMCVAPFVTKAWRCAPGPRSGPGEAGLPREAGFACRAKQISTRMGSVVAAGKWAGRRQPARKGLTQGGGGSRVKGREAIGEADAERRP